MLDGHFQTLREVQGAENVEDVPDAISDTRRGGGICFAVIVHDDDPDGVTLKAGAPLVDFALDHDDIGHEDGLVHHVCNTGVGGVNGIVQLDFLLSGVGVKRDEHISRFSSGESGHSGVIIHFLVLLKLLSVFGFHGDFFGKLHKGVYG